MLDLREETGIVGMYPTLAPGFWRSEISREVLVRVPHGLGVECTIDAEDHRQCLWLSPTLELSHLEMPVIQVRPHNCGINSLYLRGNGWLRIRPLSVQIHERCKNMGHYGTCGVPVLPA
jgi:hypothetical protein